MTRFPAAANCDAAIKGRSTSAIWNPIPQSLAFIAVRSFVLTRLGHGACGKTFGGATDSSAPESTTVSTKGNPALGVSLATEHTDFVSASFIKCWTRGTRVYQHHSGAWLRLTFFLLPKLVGRTVVFLRTPVASVYDILSVGLRQNCKPSLPSEALAETNVPLAPESRHSSNQATTHRQMTPLSLGRP